MNDLINAYIPNFSIAPCQVCRSPVPVDKFGQGECPHCGWHQEAHGIQYPADVIYPNMVSFDKAKALWSQGLPLAPSFDDFIGGLKYYKEVQFEYRGILYAVCWQRDGVNFSTDDGDDKLLIDIWDNVQNADYM